MRIFIAGAGEVGTHLAKMLSQENHDIILMDSKEERLSSMNSTLEVLPVVGSSTSLKDLEEAGIRKSDLFVGVTPEETANVTSCILAHSLGVHKTFARINNYEYLQPKNKELFEKLGISSMIYPEMLAAHEIVTAVEKPWTRQYSELFGGTLILIGVKVRDNAKIVNKKLYELLSDQKFFHIVAIKRGNETIIPRGTDQIESGDILFFTTTRNYIEDVRLLAGKKNPEVKKVEDLSNTDRARFEKLGEKERLEEVFKFERPYPEINVTPEVRQAGFESFVTTDDHLMHLTGIAKDQNGTKYYITKNSWGTDRNKFGGYLNMSESFVRAKTIYVMVHKDAIPKAIKGKLHL